METARAFAYWVIVLTMILFGGSVVGMLLITAWLSNPWVTAAALVGIIWFIAHDSRKW